MKIAICRKHRHWKPITAQYTDRYCGACYWEKAGTTTTELARTKMEELTAEESADFMAALNHAETQANLAKAALSAEEIFLKYAYSIGKK